jgi:tetratricopeptide (TPR) repeat protein
MGLHRNLGDALARLGDGTEARREYTRALELADNQLRVNPRDAPTLALVGLLEAKLGRKADARTHVDAALDIAPSNSEILYRSAVVAALAGEHDRALAAFKDALAQGYSAALADRDPDLQTLNTLPEFRALLPPRTPRQ